jgi:hypothetical protein
MQALRAEVIVPRHGSVGDLAKTQRDTGAYLDWLIEHVGAAQADWGPLNEVAERFADASPFSHLANFNTLHRSNINGAYLDFERGGD